MLNEIKDIAQERAWDIVLALVGGYIAIKDIDTKTKVTAFFILFLGSVFLFPYAGFDSVCTRKRLYLAKNGRRISTLGNPSWCRSFTQNPRPVFLITGEGKRFFIYPEQRMNLINYFMGVATLIASSYISIVVFFVIHRMNKHTSWGMASWVISVGALGAMGALKSLIYVFGLGAVMKKEA